MMVRLALFMPVALASAGGALGQVSTDDTGLMSGIGSSRQRIDEHRRIEEEVRQRRSREAERSRVEQDARQLATGGFPFQCTIKCSGGFGAPRGTPTTMATYAPDASAAAGLLETAATNYCKAYPFDRPGSLLFNSHSRALPSVHCQRKR